MKKTYDNSLKYHIIIASMVLILVLCLALSMVSFYIFRTSMMEMYTSRLRDIVELTIARIDTEDLEHCIETKERSEKFDEMVEFIEQERKYLRLEYIVLNTPVKNGDTYDIMQIVSGLTEEQKNGEGLIEDVPVPVLGDMIGMYFGPEICEASYNIMVGKEDIVFSTDKTTFGDEYGALAPIRNAKGEGIAILTTGVSLQELDSVLRGYILVIAVFAILLGVVFTVLMVMWLQRRVLTPIQKIEKSASDFAKRSHLQKDPSVLVLENPGIHTGDELESLSDTLVSMSKDMQDYVKNLLTTNSKLDNMALEMTKVNDFALRDALTGVKNKAAYDKTESRLNSDIVNQTARFGMVMIDINYLKRVNDTFGHECGDLYIKNMSNLICDVFEHSPVFRVGGDEFVVLLENRDFEHRDRLIGKVKTIMDELRNDKDLQPWERLSAAMGVAVYDPNIDKDAYSVLKRADKEMYDNKKEMKADRRK